MNLINLFTGKNLKILILIVIAIISIIILMSLSNKPSKNNSTSNISKLEYQTTLQYCEQIEKKLESVLGQISGAGVVKVMVSVDGSPELVYATDTDSKTSNNSNGTTMTSSSTPIIVSGTNGSNPLILRECLPNVKGVIVVSSGANQIGIKLDILNAVSNLLDISTDKISVLKGL